MHIAAIDWLSISINLLLVVFVVVCLLLILLVLMQRPKQEGLGAAFGGGVTDQVFGARTTNVLQRGTVYLASLFFLISLALAVLIGNQNRKEGLLKPEEEAAKAEETAPAAPAEVALPKSLSEELPAEEPATTGETPATGETTTGEAPAVEAPAEEPPAVEETPAPEETTAPEAPAPADESSEENPDQP
jgi:preprotein translocase subunit SecG